jgi:lipopolysaccharide transport system ATP-binding protein
MKNTLKKVTEDNNLSLAGDTVLSVSNLGKKFTRNLKRSLYYGMCDISSDLFLQNRSSSVLRKGEFWALKDISFQLQRGESLGVIGANGAGKTTLLRLISGIIKPDTGNIAFKGNIAPLISLNAGFSPVLTGRENITSNLAILGLNASRIKKVFDSVIDFAGIEEAIDAPVQTYSAGMVARLGFSCAVHSNPTILIIDEILAVGDINFRLKCYHKLHELRQSGTAFLLVSHNPVVIASTCTRALFLSGGKLLFDGETNQALAQSEHDSDFTLEKKQTTIRQDLNKNHDSVENVKIFSKRDKSNTLICGEPGTIRFRFNCNKQSLSPRVIVTIKELSLSKAPVAVIDSATSALQACHVDRYLTVNLSLPFCAVPPGHYALKAMLIDTDNMQTLDIVEYSKLKVEGSETLLQCGILFQKAGWSIQSEQSEILTRVENS